MTSPWTDPASDPIADIQAMVKQIQDEPPFHPDPREVVDHAMVLWIAQGRPTMTVGTWCGAKTPRLLDAESNQAGDWDPRVNAGGSGRSLSAHGTRARPRPLDQEPHTALVGR